MVGWLNFDDDKVQGICAQAVQQGADPEDPTAVAGPVATRPSPPAICTKSRTIRDTRSSCSRAVPAGASESSRSSSCSSSSGASRLLAAADIVVTTALIPGRAAPVVRGRSLSLQYAPLGRLAQR